MKFFTDYRNLKCNYEQFEFIKPYLYADGWSWYSDELTPKDLVMIQPHRSYIETWFKNPNENKFFILLSAFLNDFERVIEFCSQAISSREYSLCLNTKKLLSFKGFGFSDYYFFFYFLFFTRLRGGSYNIYFCIH